MLTFAYKKSAPKQYQYKDKDGCKITQNGKTFEIEIGGKKGTFTEEGKSPFKNATGEEVTELSGLVTDGEKECSWAIVKVDAEGHSPLHVHKVGTEVYYILAGNAKVMLDGKEHILTAGDHLLIEPGQQHQLSNVSASEKLDLLVSCKPSWTPNDFHLVEDHDYCKGSQNRPV